MERIENGNLLQVAENGGFDVFVTGDRSLHHEQNLTGRRLSIVASSCIEWRILRDNLLPVVAAIDHALPGTFHAVDCGTFDRKKPDPV